MPKNLARPQDPGARRNASAIHGGATMGEWDQPIADYLAWQRAAGRSKEVLRTRFRYLTGLARAARVGPWQVTTGQMIDFLARDGWAPETRKSARGAIRSFYLWALETDRILIDPSRKLPAVRVPAGKPRPAPERIVLAALLTAEPRERLMVLLGAFQGLRCAEISRVHGDDFDGESLRVKGKGGKVRILPVHPVVATYLIGQSGWLFPGKDDGHLSAIWVGALLRKLLGSGWSAHTLRHRFASQAYAAERDLRAVQELLGHSKPETTARYTAIPDGALRAAVMGASLVA